MTKNSNMQATLVLLDVVKDVLTSLGLLTPRADDAGGAADDLDGLAISVVLAQANPLAQDLGVLNLDQRDGVLRAQSSDELNVGGFVAALREDAQVGLTAIQGLDSLVQATSQT